MPRRRGKVGHGDLDREALADPFASPLHQEQDEVVGLEGGVRPDQLEEECEEEEGVGGRERQEGEVLADQVSSNRVVPRLTPEDWPLAAEEVERDLCMGMYTCMGMYMCTGTSDLAVQMARRKRWGMGVRCGVGRHLDGDDGDGEEREGKSLGIAHADAMELRLLCVDSLRR